MYEVVAAAASAASCSDYKSTVGPLNDDDEDDDLKETLEGSILDWTVRDGFDPHRADLLELLGANCFSHRTQHQMQLICN